MPSLGYNPSNTEGTPKPTLPDPSRASLRLPSFRSFFSFFSGTTMPNTPFAYSTASNLTLIPITLNRYIHQAIIHLNLMGKT